MSTPIGSSCRTTAELGVVGAAAPGRGADEVPQLDLGQADPPVDRRGHPAIAQVDPGVGDALPSPRRRRPGRRRCPSRSRHSPGPGWPCRLRPAPRPSCAWPACAGRPRPTRRSACRATARGAPRPRPARASTGPPASWACATSRALESCAFFRAASACSSAAWASASLALKGSSSMTNRSWPFLTSAPSWKWISLRNPRTRARIETSWSAASSRSAPP